MHTYEIPRDKWADELTSFGESHHHWLASVEILGVELGAQPEVRNLPLEGLSADPAHKGGTVSIFVERGHSDHLTRLISSPTRITVEEDDEGAAVEIESADGRTVLTLLPPGKAKG